MQSFIVNVNHLATSKNFIACFIKIIFKIFFRFCNLIKICKSTTNQAIGSWDRFAFLKIATLGLSLRNSMCWSRIESLILLRRVVDSSQ